MRASQAKSPYASPRSARQRTKKSLYHTPTANKRSRRHNGNIRTVADVPLSTMKAARPHRIPTTSPTKCCPSPSKKASVCCICLDAMDRTEMASIDCCDHRYHVDCITSWSSIENACPLCKKRFTSIVDGDSHSIAVEKKDQAPSYHIELGNIIWVDCACIICGSDDDEQLLLLCDGCDCATHTYCAGLGDVVPSGNYYCDGCKSRIGDLVEMGLSPSAIFVNHDPSARTGSILDVFHDGEGGSGSDGLNGSDEEYVPSTRATRRSRGSLRSRSVRTRRAHNRNGSTRANGRAGSTSDEEYVPDTMSRVEEEEEAVPRRRSKRLERLHRRRCREDAEKEVDCDSRAQTVDITHSEHDDDGEGGPKRARSVSPVCERANHRNPRNERSPRNDANDTETQNTSLLDGLSVQSDTVKTSHPGSRSRFGALVVVDQDNRRHILMRRRKASFRKHAPNSLAMLFGPMPARTARPSAKAKAQCRGSPHRNTSTLSTQSTVTTSSSTSILSQEDSRSGIMSEDQRDSDTPSVEPDRRRAHCIPNCGMMTRSKLRRKLERAKSKKASPRKSSLTSLQMGSGCRPSRAQSARSEGRNRERMRSGGGRLSAENEMDSKEGEVSETQTSSRKQATINNEQSRRMSGTEARKGSRKRKRAFDEMPSDHSGSEVKDKGKRRKLRARSYSSLSNF